MKKVKKQYHIKKEKKKTLKSKGKVRHEIKKANLPMILFPHLSPDDKKCNKFIHVHPL